MVSVSLVGVFQLCLNNCHIKQTITWAPLRLFGDDVGRHNCFTMLVLGFTDVVSKVDGLHVFYSHDTLGDPRGVTQASVNQPRGSVDVNWALVLHNKKHDLLSVCWLLVTVGAVKGSTHHSPWFLYETLKSPSNYKCVLLHCV